MSKYWENRVLYSWGSYEEMWKLRYGLQDYMLKEFEFDKFRGKKVLEIGCGGGIDSIEFAKHGAIVIATDLTNEAIRVTSELAKKLDIPLTTRRVDVCHLPFLDNSIDHIHCFGVLHHIPNVEKAISEMYRVLKENGTCYAMLYHKDSILYNYSILFLRGIQQNYFTSYSEQEILNKFSEAKDGCPYTKVYTKKEAEILFNTFRIVNTSIHYNVYDTLTKRKVKFLGPKHLGWHLVVKVIK